MAIGTLVFTTLVVSVLANRLSDRIDSLSTRTKALLVALAIVSGSLTLAGTLNEASEPAGFDRLLGGAPGAVVPASGGDARAGYGPVRDVVSLSVSPEGFVDGVHLNSIIDNPYYGDERNFLTVAKAVGRPEFRNEVSNVEGLYVLRAYVENGANDAMNEDGSGIARNVRIRFDWASGISNGFNVVATLTADNAIPPEIYDGALLLNERQRFDLEYVPGSAKLFSETHPDGRALDDEIIDDGILLGVEALDGNLPAGYEYQLIVTIEVQAQLH
jgi:hypothetical protein